ncbi:aminotransferase class V-fold PLP-dependent enzyme [Ruegeria marina]|nr:aminotransferase class V-fold PLP-dependent enzyme [Ruegeria marina]
MSHPDVAATIRQGVIGEGRTVPTSERPKPLVYADYVASGRALRQIEEIMLDEVLPFYANTHNESSFVGAFMTRLREEALEIIAAALLVPESHAVLFCESGATEGLNRIVRLLDIERVARNGRAVVLIGPYEHHSNILPWRESGATVVEIAEDAGGRPDADAMEAALRAHAGADLIVGSFSVASNVTGTLTDSERVTRTLKQHGALAIWDYACAGLYVPITLGDGDARKDAIVISAHKFVGGPGASGLLICDRSRRRDRHLCLALGASLQRQFH